MLDILGSSELEEIDVHRLTFDVFDEENKRDLQTYVIRTFKEIAKRKRADGIRMPET